MNVLFICSRNQWRSPTGELVWQKTPGVFVRSAGTSPRARRTVSAGDMNWADIVFVMEQKHKNRIKVMFPKLCRSANIHVLDIPDEYQYGDTELMEILKQATEPYILP